MKEKVNFLKISSILMSIAVCITLIWMLAPVFASYSNSERLLTYIESFGVWGALVLLLIQIFQIIVAFIPGELVEFTAGVLYKTTLGTVICLIGIVIGEFLIFKFVEVLSCHHPERVKVPEKLKNAKFLNNEKKLEYVIFLLFFIPGTPKDMLTYFVPLTKISVRKFLVLSCIARIPSVVSSTYAGATFADGNFLSTLIVYLVIGTVSLIGLYVHNRIIEKGEKNVTR